MDESQPAANPINPRGIPRGPAKPDVYWALSQLDEKGLDELERDALESGWGRRFGYEQRGRPPSGEVIAQALLLRAELHERMGEELPDRVRRIRAAHEAGDINEEEHDAL